tara:strand:- start:1648 stop:2253 length:606 start_codon:yes stop_codon:yes gene_type:complete
MFVFDLETIPDPDLQGDLKPQAALGNAKKPETIKNIQDKWAENGQVKAMSVSPFMNKIVCGSFLGAFGQDTIIDDEVGILRKFWGFAERFDIIGFNIFNFDIPTIKFRSLINGIKPTINLPMKRYYNQPICDLAMILCNWNLKDLKPLNFYLQRLGINAKTGDGSMVYGWHQAGETDKIAHYCEEEVKSIKQLHSKLNGFY